MAYQSLNPYDGKVLKTFEELTDKQLETAVHAAEQSFKTWRHTTFAERSAVLARAAAILRSRVEDFARPITLEMGKLIEESRGEVALSADILDYYAENAERFLAPQKLTPASGEAAIESSPLGVIFGVEPWNFPYYQLARFVAPNLMVGNVVLVKHASNVPQCAIAFADLFVEAGAPMGAYTNLLISKAQVARVIADPRIKGVALTGSSVDQSSPRTSRAASAWPAGSTPGWCLSTIQPGRLPIFRSGASSIPGTAMSSRAWASRNS